MRAYLKIRKFFHFAAYQLEFIIGPLEQLQLVVQTFPELALFKVCIYLFILFFYLFIYLFYLFIHLFIYLFIYLFIHLFIYFVKFLQQFCKVLTSNVTVKPFLRLRLSLREKFPNTEFFLVRIFRVFGLNTEICGVNLRNESECRKMRTRKNSLFGHLSRSVSCLGLFS